MRQTVMNLSTNVASLLISKKKVASDLNDVKSSFANMKLQLGAQISRLEVNLTYLFKESICHKPHF